jgi:hypothetical protein
MNNDNVFAAVDQSMETMLAMATTMVEELEGCDLRSMDLKEKSQWLTVAHKTFGLLDKIRRTAERQKKIEANTGVSPTKPAPPPVPGRSQTEQSSRRKNRKPIEEMSTQELKQEIARTQYGKVLEHLERHYDQVPSNSAWLNDPVDVPDSVRELLKES